ncbi:MAG TPA: NTP transferase domain-containing protein [Actinomycetota bacterium]|nr:NTP transferase domain-containing protein [Actinomycetota bacterium]
MYPVAILAGGRGTRMAGRTGPLLPKAMLPVAGRPFIDHKLEQLAAEGTTRVVLLLGHGAGAIADHVGDGARYGLEVAVVLDGEVLLGTGGAVRRALPELGEVFWVTYGDTLLSVPVAAAEAAFRSTRRPGLMTVLENHDAWDLSNVAVSGDLVVEYRKGAPPGTFAFIDYGMVILTRAAVASFPEGAPFDLAEVLHGLVHGRQLTAFAVTERFHEIGSDAGYVETDRWLRSRPAGGLTP